MADSSNNSDDNALAYAAVSLFANPSRGAAPQWHELSAWREGTLGAERSDQILSHVANDPECFQQWLDIIEAEHWVDEQNTSTANPTLTEQASSPLTDTPNTGGHSESPSTQLNTGWSWLRSLFNQSPTVYGGAFAAVLLAVLIVPLMREGDIDSVQQQLDRSLDTYLNSDTSLPVSAPLSRTTKNLGGLFDDLSQADVTRQHFQYGMQQVAAQLSANASPEWQTWITALANSPTDCSLAIDQADCEAAASDLTTLGQWTMLNYAACQQRNEFNNQDYWTQQLTSYQQLSDTDNLTENLLFGPVLKPLTTQSSDAMCNVVDQLITAGL